MMRNWLVKILAIDAPRKWIVFGTILYVTKNWWLDFPITIADGKYINPDLDFLVHYSQNELTYFLFIYLICKPRVNDVVARGLLIYAGGELLSVLLAQLYYKGDSFNDYPMAITALAITMFIDVKNKPEKYKRTHKFISKLKNIYIISMNYLKRLFKNDKDKSAP